LAVSILRIINHETAAWSLSETAIFNTHVRATRQVNLTARIQPEAVPFKQSHFFIGSQIIGIFKQAEAGTPVPGLCRTHGISSAGELYKYRVDAPLQHMTLGAKILWLALTSFGLVRLYSVNCGVHGGVNQNQQCG